MTVYAHIDTKALTHNLKQVKRAAPYSKVIAMIKGNAYGHGYEVAAKALEAADVLGVARLEEGILLREQGFTNRIMVLNGFSTREEYQLFIDKQLEPVLHSTFQLELLDSISFDDITTLWVKLDTGMHRAGLHCDKAVSVFQRLKEKGLTEDKLHWLSHFACADELDNSMTLEQADLFEKTLQNLPGMQSLANSAAILRFPTTHKDYVRPGIMLYGISPFSNEQGEAFNLKPVMTLKAPVVAVKKLEKGDKIGYGATWTCDEAMPVGLIAVGYGDGYPRHAISGTPVLLNGHKTQILGRVSMDLVTVDLRNMALPVLGDDVTLWGKGMPIEEVALKADTIAYELTTRLTRRVTYLASH